MDEDARIWQPDIIFGESLDRHSVSDLEERVERLKAEIARTQSALEARRRSLGEAENLFKR